MVDLNKYREQNQFMGHNHIEPIKAENDSSEVKLVICNESRNPRGFVHGGLLMTMADCAAGLAARCDGRDYVTQTANVNYISNVKDGEVRAYGSVIHRGGTVTIVRVRIVGPEDKLLAEAAMKMFCVTRK